MYATIEEINHSNTPWETWTVNYTGPLLPGQLPKWMTVTYEFSCQNTHQLLHQQLAPSHFKNRTNYWPYRQFNKTTRKHVYQSDVRRLGMVTDGMWYSLFSLFSEHRIKYLLIQLPRVSCLSLWHLVVIKQQYQSWLGIRSTTLSINLLELSPMQLNVGMALGFSHHHFSQSLKVHSWMPNDMSNRILFIELKHLASIARPLNFEVFLPAISYMFSGIIWATQARHDNTRAHTLPRWTLEMGNL